MKPMVEPTISPVPEIDPKKGCDTCLNRCMDMDMDPYCAAPKVRLTYRYGLSLSRNAIPECKAVEGKYELWEKDTRR